MREPRRRAARERAQPGRRPPARGRGAPWAAERMVRPRCGRRGEPACGIGVGCPSARPGAGLGAGRDRRGRRRCRLRCRDRRRRRGSGRSGRRGRWQEGEWVVVAVAGAGVADAEVEVRAVAERVPVVPTAPIRSPARYLAARAHRQRRQVEVGGVEAVGGADADREPDEPAVPAKRTSPPARRDTGVPTGAAMSIPGAGPPRTGRRRCGTA